MQLYEYCVNNAIIYKALFYIFLLNTESVQSRKGVVCSKITSKAPFYKLHNSLLSGIQICVLGKVFSCFFRREEVSYDI